MRTLLLILTFLSSTLSQSALAADITMDECNAQIAEMNANLPMQLDGITTWTSTVCVDKGNAVIDLTYVNEVADGNAITQTQLDTVLPSLIASWCFGPTLAPLLQVVDTIHYSYDFANGQHIGDLYFTEQDCNMAERFPDQP
jgi:hypothetical protein